MFKKLTLALSLSGISLFAQVTHQTGSPARKGNWSFEIQNRQTIPLYVQLYDHNDKPLLPGDPKKREIPAAKNDTPEGAGYYRLSGIIPSQEYALFIWREPAELTELEMRGKKRIGFGAAYSYNIAANSTRKHILLTINKDGNLIPQGQALKNFSVSLIQFDPLKNVTLKDITNTKDKSDDDFDEDFTII